MQIPPILSTKRIYVASNWDRKVMEISKLTQIFVRKVEFLQVAHSHAHRHPQNRKSTNTESTSLNYESITNVE